MTSATAPAPGRFEFERDTFAFANELVWEYRLDPETEKMISRRTHRPSPYTHRCFVLVRSARQFFYHARFDPALPKAAETAYRSLVREVVSRSAREFSPPERRVVIPGYDSLRSFSIGHAASLKAECGGAWQSYVLRSHWRMILPVWRAQQERIAAQLARSLPARKAVIVHLFRFPQLTINHGIVLYQMEATPEGLRFAAYDPNQPAAPVTLDYHRGERTFSFPQNHYWAGGKVNVVETYCGWFY